MATARLVYDYLFPGVIPGSVFSIPENLDYRPGTALFSAVQGSLISGLTPPYKTVQFAAAAGLPGNSALELVTSALNVLEFNLRYTPNVLQHTHGHIPFDNQTVAYADAALDLGIQRWTGDADALNYIAQYYTPTGRLGVPVQTLHGDRDPVVPAWHEAIYAQVVADQGTSDLLEQTIVASQTEGPIVSALVKRGQTVDVIDDQGEEIHGKIRTLSSTMLTLDRNGTATEIPFDRIAQIARPTDGLGDGALIGLGTGAAFGLLGSTLGTDTCEGYPTPCGSRWVISSTLVFGAIGAAIGVCVDALVHRDRVIYRRESRRQTRVAPVVGPGVGAAVVSVSW